MRRTIGICVALLVGAFLYTPPTVAAPRERTSLLERAVDLNMVKLHQYMLQEIAKRNDNNRAAGTTGYDQAGKYVTAWLKYAGYKVTKQEFDFPYFQELTPPVLSGAVTATPNVPEGIMTLTYSGSGSWTVPIQAVDVIVPIGNNPPGTSTSGCEATDFAGFVAGNIALIQRGTCTFGEKVQNAQAAGAVGVIIFNEGQEGRIDALRGTLGGPGFTIPAVFANYHIGEQLVALAQAGTATVTLAVDAISEVRKTYNIIADTPHGDDSHTVVVGGHLDSVVDGPGINDNGSGTAAILETACKMGWLHLWPKYKVRFAFFSAEEEGLLGSAFYVASLSPEELAKISMNLNFDMLASKNYVRYVFDGDGSDSGIVGPPGSEVIEQMYVDYFGDLGLPTDPTALDGRSDYQSFADLNIPVGGLFSGADDIKTAEQAAKYGGTAGQVLDACYHTACDTIDSLDYTIEKQFLKGVAHAVHLYGHEPLVVTAAPKTLRASAVRQATYRGPLAIR
jgi:Zn-dependent M28 family amino/carboxypeptidase